MDNRRIRQTRFYDRCAEVCIGIVFCLVVWWLLSIHAVGKVLLWMCIISFSVSILLVVLYVGIQLYRYIKESMKW